MGIPSYYKKLIDTIPGLISKEPKDIHWLFMDFNCLIYHCIDHVQIKYSKEKHNEWENEFIEIVIFSKSGFLVFLHVKVTSEKMKYSSI